MLAMTAAAFVTLTAVLLENGDLASFLVFENFECDGRALDERGADPCFRTGPHHEDLTDLDVGAFFSSIDAIEEEYVLFRNGKLAALGLNRGFHGKTEDKRTG